MCVQLYGDVGTYSMNSFVQSELICTETCVCTVCVHLYGDMCMNSEYIRKHIHIYICIKIQICIHNVHRVHTYKHTTHYANTHTYVDKYLRTYMYVQYGSKKNKR